jgi:hypothetical protein
VDGIVWESVTVNVSMIASMKSLETLFMFPLIKGKLSLYWYTGENQTDLDSDADLSKWNNYWEAYSSYSGKPAGDFRLSPKTRYIQKAGEPGTGVDAMAMQFANKMAAIVEDCPALATKVKGKEKGYRGNDLEKIIEEYNACIP